MQLLNSQIQSKRQPTKVLSLFRYFLNIPTFHLKEVWQQFLVTSIARLNQIVRCCGHLHKKACMMKIRSRDWIPHIYLKETLLLWDILSRKEIGHCKIPFHLPKHTISAHNSMIHFYSLLFLFCYFTPCFIMKTWSFPY